MFFVGSVESHMILYDSTRSYVRSYHFYDPSTILIVLVRWDRKIVWSYDPDRDFNNHGVAHWPWTHRIRSSLILIHYPMRGTRFGWHSWQSNIKVQIVYKTPWTFRSPNYKLPIQVYYQTIYVWNMNISLNIIDKNNLNQIKSQPQQKLNGKD